MLLICKYKAGSHSYGLDIDNVSDEDIRGVFLSQNISDIIGLDKNEYIINQNNVKDVVYYELRHFLKLLKKGNVGCLEMLHNTIWLEKTKEFDLIQKNKDKLLDSETIYKCF